MRLAEYLVDTSALARILRNKAVRARWEPQITAGLLAVCPIVELEFLYSAQSTVDRDTLTELLGTAFTWHAMPDRVYLRASEVQSLLTDRGLHRSASAVDLLIAATAELENLTLLHYDRDFEQ